MRAFALCSLVLLLGCPGKSSDTGTVETCCSFACHDGTTGEVSFTVDAADCSSYAESQCDLAGAEVSQADFTESACL